MTFFKDVFLKPLPTHHLYGRMCYCAYHVCILCQHQYRIQSTSTRPNHTRYAAG